MGFLVDRDMPGFTAPEIKHKMSLRASVTSELIFEDVEVPESNRLPGSGSFETPADVPEPGPLRYRMGGNRRRYGLLRYGGGLCCLPHSV